MTNSRKVLLILINIIFISISGWGHSKSSSNSNLDKLTTTVNVFDSQRDYSSNVKVMSEGADRVIGKIFLGGTLTQDEPQVISRLKDIGKLEGFSVEITKFPYTWIEDQGIVGKSGEIFAIPTNQLAQFAYKEYLGYSFPSHGQAILIPEITVEDLTSLQTNSILIGGNVLVQKQKDGKPGAIIGLDSLLLSTFYLQRKGYFLKEASLVRINELINRGFDIQKIRRIIESLNRNSLLMDDRLNKPRESMFNSDQEQRNFVSSLVIPRQFSTWSQQMKINFVELFLAKQELAKTVIADDLGLPEHRIVFVNQHIFHIDMFLRPGPGAIVFIQDYEKSIELVRDLYGEYPDREHGYVYSAALSDAGKQGAILSVKQQLEAFYDVISIAGIFNSPRDPINYMNGIMGAGDDYYYYITNQSRFHELDEAFANALKPYNIHTYFVSHNLLKRYGGLDCVTLEQMK